MFTQDIVDFLDRRGKRGSTDWLNEHPAILNFVTCPSVNIRPAAFEYTQRIQVSENRYGRFVTIIRRDGARSYILQITDNLMTIDDIDNFIDDVEAKSGSCHVERAFLVVELPAGYQLVCPDAGMTSFRVTQLQCTDIGLQ